MMIVCDAIGTFSNDAGPNDLKLILPLVLGLPRSKMTCHTSLPSNPSWAVGDIDTDMFILIQRIERFHLFVR